MECRQDYCVYNQQSQCILQTISIDELGMCEDCMMVPLPADFLETAKNEHREALRLRH